jgi:BirA family biotin operon repressor/biotin-[acetyl-CoA-carboxylase] ligase
MRVERYRTLTSTNDRARELRAEGAAHGTVVLAEQQTAGRGRQGRGFHSPPGENLYFTVLLRPNLPFAQLMPLTAFAGVAVCEGIAAATGQTPRCKWPNDVLLGGKKLCGILAETVTSGGGTPDVLLGIGINVNTRRFPPELRDRATSLRLETGRDMDRETVLQAVLARLDALHDGGLSDRRADWLDRYRSLCDTPGSRVNVTQGSVTRQGLALYVDENAALRVRFDGGAEETVLSGEVTRAH